MKEIVGYKCKNCGKIKGKHRIAGENMYCPNPGRSSFSGFSTEKQYEPNMKKPVYGLKL